MKNIFLICLSICLTVACSKQSDVRHEQNVPENWYASDKPKTDNNKPSNDDLSAMTETVDAILAANAEALEAGDADAQGFLSPLAVTTEPNKNDKPKDWVPWRAEYFMTDLSITASGLIGVLTFKGTATNRLFWRKQGPPEHKTLTEEPTPSVQEEPNNEPVIMVQEDSSGTEMVKQLEPAIHAAVSTGKIKDTPELRKNLMKAAEEFQAIASAIPSTNEDLPWWVSRFRLDFTVDAAGRVEPVGMVGGEAQFRFEWHRIKRSKPSTPSFSMLTERQITIRKSLQDFVVATATDLNDAFGDHVTAGFKAHQIRMGIGITVKGNIGVVKGAAGLVGQIYFNRNVDRPKVRPPSTKAVDLAGPIYMIEHRPSAETLAFAAKNNIQFETQSKNDSSIFEEAIYKLDRKVFRNGIFKAAKVSQFFAERAGKLTPGAWKVYELRSAFDGSIAGGLDVVTLVGSVTAQVSMFNENF